MNEKGKNDYFFLASNDVTIIVLKVTPVDERRYVTGIEFYGDRQVCHFVETMGRCYCQGKCNKDWIVVGKCELLGSLGVSHKKQTVNQICYIKEGSRVHNISFKRDNIGFLNIKFHTEEINFKVGNFLLTEASNGLFQDLVLNPIYLFEILTFTCKFKGEKSSGILEADFIATGQN